MSKEKLYGLRDQLSKFLYDPTPEQAAWRKKMWDEGRFDESIKITKQVETQLEGVEEQIEAVEAAEPSIGEKMVTNFLLNLPLGKQLKGTGLGSLLGLAEEKMGAAEAQRLKDIEQEINQLDAIRQKDLAGGRVTSGTISGIDADIRALEDEAYELKKLLSTRLSDEPEWLPEENQFEPSPRELAEWEAENFRQKQLDQRSERYWNAEEAAQEEAYYKRIEGDSEDFLIEDIKKGLYDAGRFWQAGIDEDSSLYEALDQYKNLSSKGQAQVKDMLREDMFERLGLEDARADERFFSDSGAFDAELVDQYLNKELAGEYPKIFKKMGEAGPPSPPSGPPSPPSGPPSPPSGGDGNGESFPGDKKQFVSKAFAQRNPTVVNEVRGTSEWFGLKLDEAELQKLSAEDAETAKEVIKKEKRAAKMMPEVQMYGETEKREVYRDIDAYYKPYLDVLNKKIKGYQGGGLVMNYGDYGRSYK